MKKTWSKSSLRKGGAGLVLLACLIFSYSLMSRKDSLDKGNRSTSLSEPGRTRPTPPSSSDSTQANPLIPQIRPSFTPSDEFKRWFSQKTALPWSPFSQLRLVEEVAEGMQLQPGEEEKLKKAVERLIETASAIQFQDAYFSKTETGDYNVMLVPKKQKWQGIESRFKKEVVEAVGSEKGEYFLESSKAHLNLVTGNYGQTTRMIRLENLEKFGAPGVYNITTDSGGWVVNNFSHYFTPDEQKNFGRVQEPLTGQKAFTTSKIDNPPVFLKLIMEKIQKMESSTP